MIVAKFENKKFAKAVKEKRTSLNLSLRATSDIVGIAFSNICRIEKGGMLDAISLYKLSTWMEVPMDKYFKK
jgi:transcriptional regulator with XRE-family HTH domain